MKLMEIRPILPDCDFFKILSETNLTAVALSEDGRLAYSIEMEKQQDRIYFLVKYGIDTRPDVLDKNTRDIDQKTLKEKTHLAEQFFGVIFADYIFVSGRNNKARLLYILKSQDEQLKNLKLAEAVANYEEIASRIKSINKVKLSFTNDLFISDYLKPNFITGDDLENLKSSSHTFNISMTIKEKISQLIKKIKTTQGQYIIDMKDDDDDDIQLVGSLILKSTDIEISKQSDGYFHMEDVKNALSDISS